MAEIQTEAIIRLLTDQRMRHQETITRMRVRRLLINRDIAAMGTNETGTLLPPPFEKTSLAIRTMLGETAKAVQHYVSRIAANKPEVSVVPLMMRDNVSVAAQRKAGLQERFDNTLWEENGGDAAQQQCAWAQTVGGAGYYLTLPRDATFGLPDRLVFEHETDDEIEALRQHGKLSPVQRKLPSGKMVYVEAADVWAARRKQAAQQWAGRQLFSLKAYPRDMVLREKDADGIKWAAIIEQIPGDLLAPGGDLARAAERMDGQLYPYGLIRDSSGAIIGGISNGQPPESQHYAGFYNLIRFFTREEQIIMVSGAGSVDGAKVVYRGKHGCTVQGVPTCPVVEVPFQVTDSYTPGQEFATPLEQVFAYVPIINQILTLRSNASAYNLLPRWVVELRDGTTLRGEDGEPQMVAQDTVPGLDPSQAAAYPGTVKQLTIETESTDDVLEFLVNRLESVMPAPVMSGVSGTSAPAWQVHQLIQQGQMNSQPAVNNHADAVSLVVQMWHGWLRQLDVPVCFYSAPGARKERATFKALLEFDPKDLTDSILVSQELTTDEEAVVRVQVGLEMRAAGKLTDEEYYRDYARKQDVEQAIIDQEVQKVYDHVIGGIPAPPGSVIQIVADGVRGQLNYQLLQMSPNYAIASAEAMAMQATQTMSTAGAPQGGEFPSDSGQPNVADKAGVSVPGMGQAPTLSGQLGGNRPGVRAPQGAPVA